MILIPCYPDEGKTKFWMRFNWSGDAAEISVGNLKKPWQIARYTSSMLQKAASEGANKVGVFEFTRQGRYVAFMLRPTALGIDLVRQKYPMFVQWVLFKAAVRDVLKEARSG